MFWWLGCVIGYVSRERGVWFLCGWVGGLCVCEMRVRLSVWDGGRSGVDDVGG